MTQTTGTQTTGTQTTGTQTTGTQTTAVDTTADRALKAKHRAMWALGDYPAVAIDVIPELGPELVAASRRARRGPGARRRRRHRERRRARRADRRRGGRLRPDAGAVRRPVGRSPPATA